MNSLQLSLPCLAGGLHGVLIIISFLLKPTPAINYTTAKTTFCNLLSPLKSKYHFPELEKKKQGWEKIKLESKKRELYFFKTKFSWYNLSFHNVSKNTYF